MKVSEAIKLIERAGGTLKRETARARVYELSNGRTVEISNVPSRTVPVSVERRVHALASATPAKPRPPANPEPEPPRGRTRQVSTSWERQGLSDHQKDMTVRAMHGVRERFRAAMQGAGILVDDLAAAIGYTPSAVQNWAKASRSVHGSLPNVRELVLVAHELGVEPASLLPTLAEVRGIPAAPPRAAAPSTTPVDFAASTHEDVETAPAPNGVVDAIADRLVEATLARPEFQTALNEAVTAKLVERLTRSK